MPAAENPEYIARAKELEKELETALFSALERKDDAA